MRQNARCAIYARYSSDLQSPTLSKPDKHDLHFSVPRKMVSRVGAGWARRHHANG